MTVLIFLGRLMSLAAVLLTHFIRQSYSDESGRVQKFTNPVRLRLIFEDLGGVFLKLGQILAMRFDILPLDYAMELLNLLDNTRHVPNENMFAVFKEETGKDIKGFFEGLDENSIATASFAQVYKAKYQGEEVIVKIQKPGVQKYIRADLTILRIAAFFIDRADLLKAVSMYEIVDELGKWLEEELDYTVEAHNNRIIYEHAQKHKLADVIVPKIYEDLATKKILVQEFLSGIQAKRAITYLATRPQDIKRVLEEREIDLLKCANRFISDLMRQYFIDKIFHADPHPGNLFLFPYSRVGYIDFGIIGRTAYDNSGLLRFIKGATELDFRETAEGFVDFADKRFRRDAGDMIENDQKMKAVYEKTIEFITRKLTEDLAPIIEEWHFFTGNKKLPLSKRTSAIAFLKAVKAAEKYKIKFPTDVIAFIRSLLMIDMVCLKLTDDFDMVKAAKAFFDQYSVEEVKEMSAEHAPELAKIYDFSALHTTESEAEKESDLNLKTEEQRYAVKERFMSMVSALAEKYPELYNELKEV